MELNTHFSEAGMGFQSKIWFCREKSNVKDAICSGVDKQNIVEQVCTKGKPYHFKSDAAQAI